jgi:cation transport regulator ChaC
MIGILAYGSLVTDPGDEIRSCLDRRIEGVCTPFNVEYARRSGTRSGAPTLVPVPEGVGSSVKGVILVLKAAITVEQAKNMLYRREIHKVGSNETYHHENQTRKKNGLLIKTLNNFCGVPLVIYTYLTPNIEEILNPNLSDGKKAEILAEAAIKSITPETYKNYKDGIWYLYQNLESGIITPLTKPYQNEILKRANGATDLLFARNYFARQKRII